MLPSWHNQLRVVLCPDKVILLGRGRGLRRKVIIQTVLPCVPFSDAPNWQPALDTFESWLAANEIGRTKVTVILSDHFVRYALMPYSAEVASRAEEQILAKILLEDIYGELAKLWQLSVGEGGYGEARLIAAVDASLLDRISTVLASGVLSLNTITPYFVSAFNGFHRKISDSDGLFAVIEPGLMMVIAFKNAQIYSVRRVPLNGELEGLLPNLLHREMLISGFDMDAVPVYLYVVGRPDFKLSDAGGLIIHVLAHVDSFVEDAQLDMAIAGGCP
ncbi:MAG: hypothetical protein WC216_07250 [Gallionella sp.]